MSYNSEKERKRGWRGEESKGEVVEGAKLYRFYISLKVIC
jgi:hypothetical protein